MYIHIGDMCVYIYIYTLYIYICIYIYIYNVFLVYVLPYIWVLSELAGFSPGSSPICQALVLRFDARWGMGVLG